jgi:cell shape-determining protein MreC
MVNRKEVKSWLMSNPEEAIKVLDEVSHEREIARLKGQIISYGKRLAGLEKENQRLKVKLGMPVEEKRTRKRAVAPQPLPEGDPQRLSDRLAGASTGE